MKLKERINADYITAFKEKNVIAKSALSGLKAKILEAEKSGPAGTELSDGELFKILLSNVKQRKQSIEIRLLNLQAKTELTVLTVIFEQKVS